jgi:hypothetical protein
MMIAIGFYIISSALAYLYIIHKVASALDIRESNEEEWDDVEDDN